MTEYYPLYQWRQDYDGERSGSLRPPVIHSVLQNVQRRREYENNKSHRIHNKVSRPCGPTGPGLRESTTVNITHSRQERPFYTPAKQRRSNVASNQTVSSRYQGQHPQAKRLRLDRGAADCRERLMSRDTNTTPMSNSRTGYKHKRLDFTPSRFNNKPAGQDRNRSNRQKDTSYPPAKAAQPHHDKPKPPRVKRQPITLQRAPLSSTGLDAQDIRRRAIDQEQPCSSHTVPTQPPQSRQPSPKQTPPRVKRSSVKRPWRNAKLTHTPDSEDYDSDEDNNNTRFTHNTEYNGAAPQEEGNAEIQRHSLMNDRLDQEGDADDASSSDSSASHTQSCNSGSSGSSSSGSCTASSASSASDSSDSEGEVALPEEHKLNSPCAASVKQASPAATTTAISQGSSPTVATTSRQVHGGGKGYPTVVTTTTTATTSRQVHGGGKGSGTRTQEQPTVPTTTATTSRQVHGGRKGSGTRTQEQSTVATTTAATTSRQDNGGGKGSGRSTQEQVGVLPRKQMSNQHTTRRKLQSGNCAPGASEQSIRPTITTQSKVTSPVISGETHSRSTPPGPRTAMQTPHHKHRARGQAARTTPHGKRKPGVVNGQEIPNGEKPKLNTQQTTSDLHVLPDNQEQDMKPRGVASVQVEVSIQNPEVVALNKISAACSNLLSTAKPREAEPLEAIETSNAWRDLISTAQLREEAEPLCPSETSSQLPFADSDSSSAMAVRLQYMGNMCNTTIKDTSDEPAEQLQDEVPKYQNNSWLPHPHCGNDEPAVTEKPPTTTLPAYDATGNDIHDFLNTDVQALATADNVVLYQGVMQQHSTSPPRFKGSATSRETSGVHATMFGDMAIAQESADYVNAFNGDADLGFVPARAWMDNSNRSSNEQYVPDPNNVLSLASSHKGEAATGHGYYNNNNNNTPIYSNSSVSDRKDDTVAIAAGAKPASVELSYTNEHTMLVHAAVDTYERVSPVSTPAVAPPQPATLHINPDDGEYRDALQSILEIVTKAVKCTVCECPFNATVLCVDYGIKLNRPLQCVCGCVICSVCYTKHKGCVVHKVHSRRAIVNVTVNQLASVANVKWDLELDQTAAFRTEGDEGVRTIMHLHCSAPTVDELRNAFERLINNQDEMAFKYWLNSPMPEAMAYRFVCMPHIPGFWDHIAVGCHAPNTQLMLSPDVYTPRLFDVNMCGLHFHWCCFVFVDQAILAMWCSVQTNTGLAELLPITDRTDQRVRPLTSSNGFNSMLYYLHRWIRVHYGKGDADVVDVVLDCMPSESTTFAHFISTLAAKSLASSVFSPAITQRRAQTDLHYTIDHRYPDQLFSQPPNDLDGGVKIDIRQEFGCHHGVGFEIQPKLYFTANDHRAYT